MDRGEQNGTKFVEIRMGRIMGVSVDNSKPSRHFPLSLSRRAPIVHFLLNVGDAGPIVSLVHVPSIHIPYPSFNFFAMLNAANGAFDMAPFPLSLVRVCRLRYSSDE